MAKKQVKANDESKPLELTDKQKRFCEEYIIDWNATRSAKAAGYSESTAQSIGAENLTKPLVKAYIEEIQKDLAKLAGVSALRNLLEFKKIAYSNLHNYRSDWMTLKQWDEVSEDDKAAISEIYHTTTKIEDIETTIVKFKLYDKQSALNSITKMIGHEAATKIDLTSKGEKITGIEIIRKNETSSS